MQAPLIWEKFARYIVISRSLNSFGNYPNQRLLHRNSGFFALLGAKTLDFGANTLNLDTHAYAYVRARQEPAARPIWGQIGVNLGSTGSILGRFWGRFGVGLGSIGGGFGIDWG